MALTMGSSIELFLYALLLVLFMIFFGIPSIQKYQKKETISISSRKMTNGFEAPAITILALHNTTVYGWKTKSNETSSIMGRYTYTFLLDHCKEINQTDIEACISEDAYGLTDLLTNARFEVNPTADLNTSSWTWDMTTTANGRHFTWNPQRSTSPELEDIVFIAAHRHFVFYF